MTTDAPTTSRAPRKAFRSTDERLLGGVAAGLASHLGVDVLYVRGAFLLATAIGGLGAFLYAGLWLTLPTDTHLEISTPGLEAATRQGKRPGRSRRLEDVGLLVAVGAVAIGIAVLGQALFGGSVVFWPILLGVIGLAPAGSTSSVPSSAAGARRPGPGWRSVWVCSCRRWCCSRCRPGRRVPVVWRATSSSPAPWASPGWP